MGKAIGIIFSKSQLTGTAPGRQLIAIVSQQLEQFPF
jgi:hypothetical protein